MYFRAIQGRSGQQKVDPALQDDVVIPVGFTEYIYDMGSSQDSHSIIQSGLIAGRRDTQRGPQTVFFPAVDPTDEHLHRQVDCDVTKPISGPYKKWKVHQNAVYWVQLSVAQQKGLIFYQTTSNAIILHNSVPANCMAKVRSVKNQEVLYERVSLSPRPPPKVILNSAWQLGQDQEQT